MKAPQQSLKNWTDQKWRTRSGKPSTQGSKATGERYLPEAAIKSLTPAEYAATTRAKRAGKSAGIYRDWETDRKSTRLNSSH